MTDERKSSMPDDVRSFLRQVSGKPKASGRMRVDAVVDLPQAPEPPAAPSFVPIRVYRESSGELSYLDGADLKRRAQLGHPAPEEILELSGYFLRSGAVTWLSSADGRRAVATGEAGVCLLDSELAALRKLLAAPPVEPKRRKCR
jgi:hypothetical protein